MEIQIDRAMHRAQRSRQRSYPLISMLGPRHRLVAALGLLFSMPTLYGQNASATTTQSIETANAILALRADSGDLVRIHWKTPEIDIIGEPKLGENFRILVPLPKYEANYFDSREQSVNKIERTSDGVVIYYGPLRNEREQVDIQIAYAIHDTGGQLQFSIEVDNRTDRKIAEVFYGVIGGQQGIQRRLDTDTLVPADFGNLAPKLFSQYRASGLNLGGHFDHNGFGYPDAMTMGWMDVYNTKAGIGYYYANQDPENSVTALYTEMRPYARTMTFDYTDNWPSENELPQGEPIGITMGWVNFPYCGRGIFRAGPIALEIHTGDWHTAANIYRTWFDQHFQLRREPNWLRKEMAWQSFIMIQPEDKVFFRFNDLPRLAMAAKKYGVTTFEIEGWNKGGNDRGYPDFRLDPRLGTEDEFRLAVAQMKAIGVHPILMADNSVVDTSTEEFRTRYSRFTVQNRWAPDYLTWALGEGTIGSRNLISDTQFTSGRNLAWVSLAHPAFREELTRKYTKLIDYGIEGLFFDKPRPGLLDFNPDVPLSPDRSMPQGTFAAFQDYLDQARRINPQVALVSAMGRVDRAFPYVDVWRNTLVGKDPSSVAVRYTFPEWTAVILSITPGDIDELNNGMRFGLVWLVCERFFGSMDDPLIQPFSRYLSELIRIRKQHAELLFHGRFLDTLEANVSANKDAVRYSVFAPLKQTDSQRGCVVVNFGDSEEAATVSISGKDGQKVKIYAPFEADRTAVLPATLTIPAHRIAVMVTE